MRLGICSRSKDVIEPLMKPQWYVSMKEMAAEALKAVESEQIIINPKVSEAEYKRWMENIQDWCISRQLWWGHQAPVYYVKIDGETQNVQSFQHAADHSQMKVNGGLLVERKKKSKRRRQQSSLGNLSPSNVTLMSSTHGSPLLSGLSPPSAGPILYFPQFYTNSVCC